MRSLLGSLIILLLCCKISAVSQQTVFGKNKVQYTEFDWYFIQSDHFDIYFNQGGEYIANFTADVAESSYAHITKSFRYQITSRIPIIVYNSHNDFQQTNVVNSYLDEGIGGVTELFKNRVVLPFEGDYKKFRHVIHHELVHAVINEMFYGGSIQSIITNNITLQLPLWFNEGLAEYEALKWDTNSDMFLRDASIHEYLPSIDQLNGYSAYRGGQSVWNYIAIKYGDQKISEILMRIRASRSVDQGFRSSIGLSVQELSERWQKEQKVLYWPDIAKREEASDYARRLTDHTKDGSFYNTSPTLSPQGDKIAFISNRDDYFDVFVMNTIDGSVREKLIKGQRAADFEELHLLTPGMAWSSNGKRLALATKSGRQDAVILLDVMTGKEEKIEFGLDGILSIDWSPDAADSLHHLGKLAFTGYKDGRSDIYVYDVDQKALTNLTDDTFTDADPAWSADGKSIYFSSDRTTYVDPGAAPAGFKMQKYDFGQMDIYRFDIGSKQISRMTNWPTSDESSPVVTPDGKHIIFVSDANGINNIYVSDLDSGQIRPLTNSLSGVYQLSITRDGTKLAFSSLTNGGFDLYLLRNPLERDLKYGMLEKTEYLRRRLDRNRTPEPGASRKDTLKVAEDIIITREARDSSTAYGNDVRIDLRNYVFNDAFRDIPERKTDTSKFQAVTDNVDQYGNYKVNKYKLNFSPDIIYGNAGYNTYYGIQGSTVFAFSDLLGNHQVYLLTNLLFDLKNSDYALAYLYLPKRVDYGFQIFHNARFLFLTDNAGNENLYRFRNYGVTGLATYPVDKFNRFEFDLSWFNIVKDNLDITATPTVRRSLIVPGISYIHDTSLWGIIAPANGERYNIGIAASPKFDDESLGFYTITADYRTYLRLWKNYTFAVRLAGGGSFGTDPQRFIIGGVDNWINRQFENNRFPVEQPEDFVFLTSGIPLRGYNYAQRLGTKYGLVNMEFRFPLFGYLSAGPLPLFFQSFSGALFVDVGGAWTRQGEFKGIDRNAAGDIYLRDLLVGAGYGVRMIFLGFLLKLDVAWPLNLQDSFAPKYYLSVGADI